MESPLPVSRSPYLFVSLCLRLYSYPGLYVFVSLTFFSLLRLRCPPPHKQLFLVLLLSTAFCFVTRVHSSLGASLLGFFALYYFYPAHSVFFSKKKQKKTKPKGQVGIKVDTRLNKEQPTKLQIYAPSAVCNCTQPEVCPLFAFFFFLCTVHRRCLFRTQPSPGRYFQTPPVRSRCSNKRFPWAIY